MPSPNLPASETPVGESTLNGGYVEELGFQHTCCIRELGGSKLGNPRRVFPSTSHTGNSTHLDGGFDGGRGKEAKPRSWTIVTLHCAGMGV
jgi:hypothetical protein